MFGPRGHLRDIYETLRRQPRHIWTFCTAISILTSKSLFLEANLNYPAHLHFIHFAVIAVYLVGSGIWNRRRRPEDSTTLFAASWATLALLACLMGLAIGCTLQALLHFQNTTSLLMSTTISCLVELSILLLSGRSTRKQDWMWMVPFTLSCAGILVGEYRLLPKGLRSALPALLLTGVSRAMYSIVADTITNTDWDRRRLDILFCCSGLAISGMWLYYFIEEPWMMVFEAFRWKHVPLVAVNVLTSVVAMMLGKSMLLPMITSEHRASPSGYRTELRSRDTVTIVVLTAIIGVFSSLTIHRAYTTYVQIGTFIAAVICYGGYSVKETIRKRSSGTHHGYSKVDPSREMGLVNNEGTTDDDDPVEPTGRFSRPLIVALALCISWLLFLCANFQEAFPHIEKVSPVMDLAYQPTLPVEIVISMYKEPIAEVETLISTLRSMNGLSSARVTIYIKDPEANLPNIQQLTGANNVTLLPNIGREGETYLNHIVHQWDSLAQQTFFLQAGIHNPREFYSRVANYYVPQRTGMLSLGWTGQVCNCHSCTDHWQFYDHTHLFPAIHDRINNASTCNDVLLSYKGQFIVSAARIRGVPIDVYHDLRDAFVDEESWAHQPEFLRGSGDSMAAPRFGYVLERMWNLLFQCADADVGWKCPTLLSGWRIGGGRADCQCFDGEGGVKDV